MKYKTLSAALILNLIFAQSSAGYTYIKWNAFESQYQSASFSFLTEPIVVTATDVRKMSYSTLPLCITLQKANLPTNDCIENVQASSNGGAWVDGKFDSYLAVRQLPIDSPPSLTAEWAKADIDINPSYLQDGIAGSRSSLWSFPGISHKNGNLFMLSYQLGTPIYNDKLNFIESHTEIEFQPVSVSLKGAPTNEPDGSRLSTTWVNGQECFIGKGASYCISFFQFDDTNLRFRFTLNLKAALKSLGSDSWMYAHANRPVLKQEISERDPLAQNVTLEASPVAIQVPTIALTTAAQINDYVESIYPPLVQDASGGYKQDYEATKKSVLDRYLQGLQNDGSYIVSDQENAFSMGSTYLMGRQDKYFTPGNTKEFIGLRIQSLPVGSAGATPELFQILQSCPKSPFIAGLMASNATAVETTPPTFDKKTQTLMYRVAAPHLKENGELNSGFYSFHLNPRIAKCIWGDNLLGAKAEISILNDNGEIQTAASTFLYSDGSAFFEISGFHFSSGVIKVKVNQVSKTVSSEPTPKAKPTPSTIFRTLVCKKGKVSKKITGVAPKCPMGFKPA